MRFIKTVLSSTKYTLILCFLFLGFTLFYQKSLFTFIKAKKHQKELNQELKTVEIKTMELKEKLEQVNDPKFVEKQIKERFDFVEEGDLVFIFSEK